jgi:hypothetical protein
MDQLTTNFTSYNEANIERWNKKETVSKITGKDDLFDCRYIFIPINIKNDAKKPIHWALGVIDTVDKQVNYYDSKVSLSTGTSQKFLDTMKKYLTSKLKSIKGWEFIDGLKDKEVPQQTNDIDCAIFMMTYAKHIMNGQPLENIKQSNMNVNRNDILDVILKAVIREEEEMSEKTSKDSEELDVEKNQEQIKSKRESEEEKTTEDTETEMTDVAKQEIICKDFDVTDADKTKMVIDQKNDVTLNNEEKQTITKNDQQVNKNKKAETDQKQKISNDKLKVVKIEGEKVLVCELIETKKDLLDLITIAKTEKIEKIKLMYCVNTEGIKKKFDKTKGLEYFKSKLKKVEENETSEITTNQESTKKAKATENLSIKPNIPESEDDKKKTIKNKESKEKDREKLVWVEFFQNIDQSNKNQNQFTNKSKKESVEIKETRNNVFESKNSISDNKRKHQYDLETNIKEEEKVESSLNKYVVITETVEYFNSNLKSLPEGKIVIVTDKYDNGIEVKLMKRETDKYRVPNQCFSTLTIRKDKKSTPEEKFKVYIEDETDFIKFLDIVEIKKWEHQEKIILKTEDEKEISTTVGCIRKKYNTQFQEPIDNDEEKLEKDCTLEVIGDFKSVYLNQTVKQYTRLIKHF